jgi:hypothetical protein
MAAAHGERFQCALGSILTSLPGGGGVVLVLNPVLDTQAFAL